MMRGDLEAQAGVTLIKPKHSVESNITLYFYAKMVKNKPTRAGGLEYGRRALFRSLWGRG